MKLMIKGIVLVVLFFAIQGIAFSQTTDTTANGYLLMKVRTDVLDCPHFSVLLPEEMNSKQSLELIETDNKTYMLFKIKTTYDDAETRFNQVVEEIKFPKNDIVELVRKENYNEIKSLLGGE